VIKLFILDVDGCLSDGKIIYTAEGLELKNFNVRDGFAIKHIVKMGYEVAIITGRNSTIVANRARELDIPHVYQGIRDKLSCAQELCQKLGLDASQVAVIGDDLNDYKLLAWAGISFTPADGSHYLKSVAQSLDNNGGNACVREMIEKVMIANDDEKRFLDAWI
jgi:3-deoxy-D-manno-octulosonate 8-phosphate phosphatase (KDO 8-P phosphatase)